MAPAAAAGSAAGTYVALDRPNRLVDTRLGAGQHIQPRIAGRGWLPDSGIGAVVATLTAYSPTGDGRLVAYPARRPPAANLYFDRGRTASTTVVVALHAGRLNIAEVGKSGHVRVALDVTGYYRGGSSSPPGSFHPVAPARLVDGRTLRSGRGFTAPVAGRAGVPKKSVGAVAVTIHALHPTASGTLSVGSRDVPHPGRPALPFRAGQSASAFAIVPLGSGSSIRISDDAKRGTVDVSIDVAGYYSYGTAAQAGTYEPLPAPARVGSGRIGGGRTYSVPVAGIAGVPRSHVAAAAVAITFAGEGTDVELVRVSRTGSFRLHNPSNQRVDFAFDVVGYVPATTITAPPTFVGRYVRNLTAHHDATNIATMQAEGAADAAAGSELVLLHLGAQLNDRSGVLLSGTTRQLTWAHLVTALNAYLAGYAPAGGTVAIATNNDGDWHKYPAKARGRDWANELIDALTVPDGVQVAGADDIEAGFVSTRAQAQTWEDAYLGATDQRLYFVGSADGCPITFGATGKTCDFGWTEQQYYSLAHSGSRIRVLPQVYTPDQAVQWTNIDATGGGGLIFAGALTERAAAPDLSQHPAQGWAALYRALSSRVKSPAVPAVVDLRSDG